MTENLKHKIGLVKLSLAGPQFCQPSDVNMLIGGEFFFDILCPKGISLGPNMPILQSTQFGWIIAGPLNVNASKPSQPLQCHFTKQISENLSKFCNLEELPASDLPLTAGNEFCEEHFMKHTVYLMVDFQS